jgi:WS/DGAT/MGAT family acyltransferase
MEPFFERLSARDRLFLDLEGPHAPQHVGALCLFEAPPLQTADGAIDIDRIRAHIAARLHLLPRTRQRLAFAPVEHHPLFVDDAHFELDFHVRHAALPRPGNERQLKRLIGRLLAAPLDRERPLWELHVIEGVAKRRVAVLGKIHHCMTDGVAGLSWLAALLSEAPREEIDAPRAWHPRPAPERDELLRSEVGRRAEQWLGALQRLPRLLENRERLEEWAAKLTGGAAALGETLAAALAPAPETPFNGALGPDRRFDWRSISMERAQAVRRALGGTLNDVALACVAGGLRRMLEQRGVDVRELALRASVPVNLRTAEQHTAGGNEIALMVVELPVGVPDALERLSRVREASAAAKASHQVAGSNLLALAAEWTSSALLGPAARALLAGRPYNLVVTNIPGPRRPLYLLGARLQELTPAVNLVEGQGLGVALASYAGELCFGFIADWQLVPDLSALADGLLESFEELEKVPVAAANLTRES